MAFGLQNTESRRTSAAQTRLLQGGGVLQKGICCCCYTESFSPSKCISNAEPLGGQQHQKEDAGRILQRFSIFKEEQREKSVFKEGKGGGGAGVLKAASANVFQQNNFFFFFIPLLPVFFSFSSAYGDICNPGQKENERERRNKNL